MTRCGIKRPNGPSTETVLALAGEDACATRMSDFAAGEFRQLHPRFTAPQPATARTCGFCELAPRVTLTNWLETEF